MTPADSAAASGEELAPLVAWIGEALSPGALADSEPEEAAEAADDLAAALADLPPATRGALWQAGWPADGVAVLLGRMPSAARALAAAELAAVPQRGLAVLAAALAHSAAGANEAADLLAPDSAAAVLALACQTAGPGWAYVQSIVQAAASAPPAEALPALAAALASTVVPAQVSSTAAAISDAAARFGEEQAALLVRAHMLQRLFAPALPPGPIAAAIAGIAGGAKVPAAWQDAAALLDAALAQIVLAGDAARELAALGEDPDDLLTQRGAVLASDAGLLQTFAKPSPPDGLGTLPALPMTALGQAILRARAERPGGYDWGSVLALEQDDPDSFALLLADERAIVLDLVLTGAGIDPEPRPAA